jgi:hypothetical protein
MGDVLEYLKAMVEMRSKLMPKPKGWKYTSAEEFVLKNGRPFKPAPLPENVYRGTIKECYRNALVLAMENRKEYSYCEGFATAGIVPVLHAFCVNKRGEVVDPTWGNDGIDYFGVPFDWKFIDEQIKEIRYYGFLDDWRRHWPLLRGEISNFKSKRTFSR